MRLRRLAALVGLHARNELQEATAKGRWTTSLNVSNFDDEHDLVAGRSTDAADLDRRELEPATLAPTLPQGRRPATLSDPAPRAG